MASRHEQFELKVDWTAPDFRKIREAFSFLSPGRLAQGFLRAAQRGAKHISDEAKRLAPEDDRPASGRPKRVIRPGRNPRSGSRRAKLKQAIGVRTWRPKGGGKNQVMAAIIGPKGGRAPHAHLVHSPVNPHTIRAVRANVLSGFTAGGDFATFGRTVQHPGIVNSPWLKIAFHRKKNQAQQTMARHLEQQLMKQARSQFKAKFKSATRKV